MNIKNKKLQYTVLIIVAITIAAVGIWYTQKNNHSETKEKSGAVSTVVIRKTMNESDPFYAIKIPTEADEPTKGVYQHNIDQAKQLYQEDANTWEAWIAIGNAYSLLKQPAEAIAAYEIALEKGPGNIISHRNIAEVYRQQYNNNEIAANYYRLAIRQNFSDPSQYVQLASILEHKLEDLEGAEAVYIEGARRTGGNGNIVTNLIDFYVRHGREEDARPYAEALLKKYPDETTLTSQWEYLLN